MSEVEKFGRVQIDQRGGDRFYDNVGLTIIVLVTRNFKTPQEVAQEVTIDISEGGLRFYDEWGVPENANLELVLRPLDGGRPIVHFGQVRWKARASDREGFEIGVMFTAATRGDRDIWLAYVAARRNRSTTARVVVKINPVT